MAIDIYLINESRKQVVSSKKTYVGIDRGEMILAYLNICQGDTIKIDYDHSTFVEEFMWEGMHQDYRLIKIFKHNIDNQEGIDSFIDDVNNP